MMTSVSNKTPATPARAGRRPAAVDRRLDTLLFKALSDPTRAKLLACLMKCRRPCSVGEVAECCDVDFSVVARHLGVLARAEILDAEKKGRTVWYTARCADLATRLRALADAIAECSPACDASSTCCSVTTSGTKEPRRHRRRDNK